MEDYWGQNVPTGTHCSKLSFKSSEVLKPELDYTFLWDSYKNLVTAKS